MTAEEIRKHQFGLSEDGGYSKEDVDAYIETLAGEYETLFNENKEIVRRLTIFAKKIDEYKRNESYMTETLLTAQKTAAQTIAGAEDVVAKMIEAAKNEGRNIINAAKERSNEIYVDRDKVIAEAEEKAKEITDNAQKIIDEAKAQGEKQAQEIIDNANEQAKNITDEAKKSIQATVDEINSNTDAIIKEAADKAKAMTESIIADANKAKAEGEALRSEAFEMKKNAVLFKEQTEKEALAAAETFLNNVTRKAKTAAAGILLKAQADVNRMNSEAKESVDSVNSAVEQAYNKYTLVKKAADEAYNLFTDRFEAFKQTVSEMPQQGDIPAAEAVAFDEKAFSPKGEDLDAAVANEDIDGVLKCFGIDPEELFSGADKAVEENRAAEKKEEEIQEAPAEEAEAEEEGITEIPENAEVEENEINEKTEESEENIPETAEQKTATDEISPKEKAEIKETEKEEVKIPANAIEIKDAIDDDFRIDFEAISDEGFLQQENEEREEVEALPEEASDKDIYKPQGVQEDALFDDDWSDIEESDMDVSFDDVKEFKPEVPENGGRKSQFIRTDDDFENEDFEDLSMDEPLLKAEKETEDIPEDFEIDFSMFEPHEEEQKEYKAPEVSSKKKKKRRRK